MSNLPDRKTETRYTVHISEKTIGRIRFMRNLGILGLAVGGFSLFGADQAGFIDNGILLGGPMTAISIWAADRCNTLPSATSISFQTLGQGRVRP